MLEANLLELEVGLSNTLHAGDRQSTPNIILVSIAYHQLKTMLSLNILISCGVMMPCMGLRHPQPVMEWDVVVFSRLGSAITSSVDK